MVTRREFLKGAAFLSAAMFIPSGLNKWTRVMAPTGATLDPNTITKYANSLAIPGVMPRSQVLTGKNGEPIDYYEITLRQFTQQILPTGFPATTVWSYGTDINSATYFYPTSTIEARVNTPVRVKWINGLVDSSGNYLSHLFTVDPTLHWANPPGPRDEIPTFSSTPGPYTGPVPMVTHLHGAHVTQENDGYPQAWYLPAAANLPDGYHRVGTFYEQYAGEFADTHGASWAQGSSTYQYPNDQRACTLWFHDHTLGITRLAVYAGTAGFYLIRGGTDDLGGGVLPQGSYEIPLLIQDRSFNADGSLFYPDSRAFFDEFSGPYVPDSDMAPFWNPETFGNAMVVNGRAWPHFKVEPRRYRFRFLNGCNARTLILKIASAPRAPRPADPMLTFWQIGSEGGFIQKPVELNQLLIGPAERADVIVDFSKFPQGTKLYLINEGPDMPFGGGAINTDFDPADIDTTGQVLKFEVGTPSSSSPDTSLPASQLSLPAIAPLAVSQTTRKISMNELDSDELTGVGPRIGELGTVDDKNLGVPLRWMDDATEIVPAGTTEVWEIHNYTEDAHPVHVHMVQFRVVNREDMNTHKVTGPEAWESGFKDTVIAYPKAITRIQATFDNAGRFVWHCHILEHEDNEMMRPLLVEKTGGNPAPDPGQGTHQIFIPSIQK